MIKNINGAFGRTLHSGGTARLPAPTRGAFARTPGPLTRHELEALVAVMVD